MVDMRGDGEVDANGWQYGRNFTTLAWRSNVKSFSRGGWVRRRRWVRLMVKPAALDISQSDMLPIGRPSAEDARDVWKGKVDDWASCRRAIKTRPTDGQKLELWANWLADTRSTSIVQQQLANHVSFRTSIFDSNSELGTVSWMRYFKHSSIPNPAPNSYVFGMLI
jgi:hypothetical protein